MHHSAMRCPEDRGCRNVRRAVRQCRMLVASAALTGLVALLHVYFLVLEMFLWTTPYGQKNFGRTKQQQEESKILAANQGLYNGFLAAGLAWSLIADASFATQIRFFFL